MLEVLHFACMLGKPIRRRPQARGGATLVGLADRKMFEGHGFNACDCTRTSVTGGWEAIRATGGGKRDVCCRWRFFLADNEKEGSKGG